MNTSFPSLSFGDSQVDLAAAVNDNRLAVGGALVMGAALWYLFTSNRSNIKNVRGWPVVGQWAFFTKRYDFIRENFNELADETMFKFNILQHNVVALRGEEARTAFFDSRDLSFTQGYRLLFGGVPRAKDVVSDYVDAREIEGFSWFARRLTPLLRMSRLGELTPLFMSDLERNMVKWGDHGKFDPFEDIYSMVFQLTIRAAACKEIADSVERCNSLEKLYWRVEKGSTPTSVLLPWFPSSARKQRIAATAGLYQLFDQIIKARKEEDRREDDALQVLLDLGDSTADVINFIMSTLFAGIVNSGLMSAWIFIFLDQEPEWRDKVVDELRMLLNKYAPSSEKYSSMAERLSKIPPQAWENEMPILEDCLRETIRIIFSGAMLRRITEGDVEVSGRTIPNGTFLTYLAGETHSDPSIYPNPTRYDPGRFSRGQDKSQTHAFLGWGAGRHPCLGRRFAQYEIKAICAMFLASYEYKVVDSKDKKPDPSVTVPDRNNIYQARPKNETFYVKYTKRQQQI